VKITIPGLRLESEANKRDKWAAVKRAKEQRYSVAIRIASFKRSRPPLPVILTITRIAPRLLDDDNLARACKAVRDEIAKAYSVDDRDDAITWRYSQRTGKPREYACEILIEPRVDSPSAVKTHSGGEARADVLGEYAVIELWDQAANEGVLEMFTPQQLRALIVQCERALREIER